MSDEMLANLAHRLSRAQRLLLLRACQADEGLQSTQEMDARRLWSFGMMVAVGMRHFEHRRTRSFTVYPTFFGHRAMTWLVRFGMLPMTGL